MQDNSQKFLILYSQFKDKDLSITKRLQSILNADIINIDECSEITNITQYAKIFTVGGDGTVLKAIHLANGYSIPIIGVNLGRRGYIARISVDDLENQIQDILKKASKCETFHFVEGVANEKSAVAVNDIIISKNNPLTTCELNLKISTIDGIYENSFICDGLLISTAFGSTAYNKSLQSSIIVPNCPAYVITPINPVKSDFKSIVIGDDAQITVSLVDRGKNQKALVGFDGTQVVWRLNGGENVRIQKSKNTFSLLKPINYNYFKNLQEKS